MEEYTLFEIVDLILRDIKEQAKKTLIDMQVATTPVLLLSEDGVKGMKKQMEELAKVAGIEVKKQEKEADLEDIKNLLESFKK